MATKRCPKCGCTKSPLEFCRDASRADGLACWCRDCTSLAGRMLRAAHPERETARTKKWRLENRERVRASERARYAAHPEKEKASVLKYQRAHPDKVRDFHRRWIYQHPGKNTEYCQKRRALKKGTGGFVTAQEWAEVREKYGNRCLYPGCERQDITMDHVVPLSMGGANSVENVQPLCLHHNSSKRTKTIDFRLVATQNKENETCETQT